LISEGTTVSLRAVPAAGYEFSYWTGVPTLVDVYEFDMYGDCLVAALFYEEIIDVVYTITPEPNIGSGAVYIKIEDGERVLFDTDVTVKEGTHIVLDAVPNEGWSFSKWNGLSESTTFAALEIESDMAVSAVFAQKGTGGGSSYGNATIIPETQKPEKPSGSHGSVTGVKLDKSNATIAVGETLDLVPIITPENAVNKGVIWSSSNQSVAEVDGTGEITALKPGVTMITVTTVDGRHIAQCELVVTSGSSIGAGTPQTWDGSGKGLPGFEILMAVFGLLCAIGAVKWQQRRKNE